MIEFCYSQPELRSKSGSITSASSFRNGSFRNPSDGRIWPNTNVANQIWLNKFWRHPRYRCKTRSNGTMKTIWICSNRRRQKEEKKHAYWPALKLMNLFILFDLQLNTFTHMLVACSRWVAEMLDKCTHTVALSIARQRNAQSRTCFLPQCIFFLLRSIISESTL